VLTIFSSSAHVKRANGEFLRVPLKEYVVSTGLFSAIAATSWLCYLEEVEKEVFDETGRGMTNCGPLFSLGTSHKVQADVPKKNSMAMLEALQKWAKPSAHSFCKHEILGVVS